MTVVWPQSNYDIVTAKCLNYLKLKFYWQYCPFKNTIHSMFFCVWFYQLLMLLKKYCSKKGLKNLKSWNSLFNFIYFCLFVKFVTRENKLKQMFRNGKIMQEVVTRHRLDWSAQLVGHWTTVWEARGLYPTPTNTQGRGGKEFYLRCAHSWEILSGREDKIRIPKRPCNVLLYFII